MKPIFAEIETFPKLPGVGCLDSNPADCPNARKGISHTVSKFNRDRKSTRLNSSHVAISYAVFCLKKKKRSGPAKDGTKQGGERNTSDDEDENRVHRERCIELP